jgi:hypothetical protein
MALTGEILGQHGLARAETVHRTVAQTYLHLAFQRNDELAAGRAVPIAKVARINPAEYDSGGRLHGGKIGVGIQLQVLDVGLAVVSGV